MLPGSATRRRRVTPRRHSSDLAGETEDHGLGEPLRDASEARKAAAAAGGRPSSGEGRRRRRRRIPATDAGEGQGSVFSLFLPFGGTSKTGTASPDGPGH